MADLVKKITKRTGRAFGVSDIRDDLTLLSNKLDKLTQDGLKKNEIEDFLLGLNNELKTKIGIVEMELEAMKKYSSFCYYNELAKNIHPCLFEKYRGINKGKDVVLVACGPSLDDYVVNKKMYHVGVNRAFLKKDLKFNALFMHDKMMLDLHKDELAKLKVEKFVAFATNRYNSENL